MLRIVQTETLVRFFEKVSFIAKIIAAYFPVEVAPNNLVGKESVPWMFLPDETKISKIENFRSVFHARSL